MSDNGIELPDAIGQERFAGAMSRAGYHTTLIGKAYFKTSHTFEPTGSPECRESSARYSADWNGPYMGFDQVELMLEGHHHFPPMKPPLGQHYERWCHADGWPTSDCALSEKRHRAHPCRPTPSCAI